MLHWVVERLLPTKFFLTYLKHPQSINVQLLCWDPAALTLTLYPSLWARLIGCAASNDTFLLSVHFYVIGSFGFSLSGSAGL